jgi:hypothetical protein
VYPPSYLRRRGPTALSTFLARLGAVALPLEASSSRTFLPSASCVATGAVAAALGSGGGISFAAGSSFGVMVGGLVLSTLEASPSGSFCCALRGSGLRTRCVCQRIWHDFSDHCSYPDGRTNTHLTWQRNARSQDGQQNFVFVIVSNGLEGYARGADPSASTAVVAGMSTAASLSGGGGSAIPAPNAVRKAEDESW